MRAAGNSRPLFGKGVLCVHEPRDVVTVDEMSEQDVDGEEQEDASEIEVKPAEDPLAQMLV